MSGNPVRFPRSLSSFGAILLVAVLLAGCSSGAAQLEQAHDTARRHLDELGRSLDAGTVRNAEILGEYAANLAADRPDLASLANTLARDADRSGPMFQRLRERLDNARNHPEDFAGWPEQVEEMRAIATAADPLVFNDALSDPVNVLADLSQGRLARVNAVSREQEQSANGSQDLGAGSQLIGNPGYGHWSGGANPFWVWYGQYAFFSHLFGGRRHYYGDWAGGRGYSYYHDVGRRTYSSPSTIARQTRVEQTARRSYRGNKPFQSAYQRPRSGASGISRASMAQRNAMFKSPYAKTASSARSSNYPSSTRTASRRTSGGAFRGK